MIPLTSTDSPASSTESRIASSARWSDVSPRAAPTRCQTSEKSPSSDAAYSARSATGCPRTRSSSASTRSSKARTRRARSAGSSDGGKVRQRSGRARGSPEPSGLCGIAAEGGAVRPERAEVTQLGLPGPEVVTRARALDRRPDRTELALDRLRRRVGGHGADLDRVAEVQQPHPRRTDTEVLLAQQRVQMHPVEPAPLVALRRRLAGLVVGDHEPAVAVELEPVDDAAHPGGADLRVEHELDPDRRHRRRVLQAEVLAY